MTTAMPVPAAVPMTAPANLFGLETIDLILVGDGGVGVLIGGKPPVHARRPRRERSGLCAGGERDAAGGKSKGEFQKVPTFHGISSCVWHKRRTGV